MPYLLIKDGRGRTESFLLADQKTTMGRSSDNDIVISDHGVSRHHAFIVLKGKHFHLTDLDSHNGTAVNGKFIRHVRLKDDDEIRIGKSQIIFQERKDAPAGHLETLVFEPDSAYDSWTQHTEDIGPEVKMGIDSNTLLHTQLLPPRPTVPASISRSASAPEESAEIASLARMNKVLFVLYEISRHLNAALEFKDLLAKIMDLIFVVIDADFGFLVLTSKGGNQDLTPIVVKYRDKAHDSREDYVASRTMLQKVITNRVAVLTSNAMDDSRFVAAESIIMRKIRSAICVPLWEKDRVIGAIQLDSDRPDNVFKKEDLELLKSIGFQMSMVIEQARLNEHLREEERMLQRLERFHSPQIIDMILKGNHETVEDIMEPKDLTATILFTDMVGFTSLSERMSPREVNRILNQHFTMLTDIIFRHDGTLDKFLGDGLMAIFGAPLEKKDDAERAVLAALEIRKIFVEGKDGADHSIPFDIRIGLNTGRVTAGNIGSPKRMDYTVIGDTVNIAKRLESIASPQQILIGPETYNRVRGSFKTAEVGSRMLKGKSRAIKVFEVLG